MFISIQETLMGIIPVVRYRLIRKCYFDVCTYQSYSRTLNLLE